MIRDNLVSVDFWVIRDNVINVDLWVICDNPSATRRTR